MDRFLSTKLLIIIGRYLILEINANLRVTYRVEQIKIKHDNVMGPSKNVIWY